MQHFKTVFSLNIETLLTDVYVRVNIILFMICLIVYNVSPKDVDGYVPPLKTERVLSNTIYITSQ